MLDKKFLMGSVYVFVLSCALGVAQAGLIRIEPASQTVSVNDRVNADIVVSGLGQAGAPSVGGFDLSLRFNPAVLSVADIRFSDVLGVAPLDAITDQIIDNTSGLLSLFGVSLLPPASLDTLQAGRISLATIDFSALNAGSSALEFVFSDLVDASSLPLNVASVNGLISVQAQQAAPPNPVSEPNSIIFLLLGLVALLYRSRSKRPTLI